MLLVWSSGYSLSEGWIVLSIVLYVVTGAFWLPVVWMQMRMRDLAARGGASDSRCRRPITACSGAGSPSAFPAFAAVMAIFWLMIARPQFSFI